MFVIAGPVIYFLPTVLAQKSRHEDPVKIGLLNLFLGWTMLGWIFALGWAKTSGAEVDAD